MATIIFGMQIDTGRLDRRMSQVFLDEAQVGAGVRLMRGRAVAQPVGRGAT